MKTETQNTKKRITAQQALERLETLCAKGERCTYELRQKLWNWQISGHAADDIINKLISAKFVDDTRFAKAYINDKVRFARWGQRKIALGLAQKRIDAGTVRQLLSEIDATVVEQNLLELLNTKARTIQDPRTYEGRTKLYRYALSRGYYPDVVSHVIKIHFVN